MAIAADASTSTDFPNGQIGTGRLSFRCHVCSLKQSTGLFLNREIEDWEMFHRGCAQGHTR